MVSRTKGLATLGIALSDLLHEGTHEAWTEAWSKLTAGFDGDIRRFLTSRGLSDPTELDDVTEEVWIRAWTYLSSYDATRPILPWLLRIADNAQRDFQRTRAHRPEEAVDVEHIDLVAGGQDADGTLLRADTVARLQHTLRPRDLELLDLTWRGFAASEIAAVLGITQVSVHEMLSRARRLARASLREQ